MILKYNAELASWNDEYVF